jgi:hypothetical protein
VTWKNPWVDFHSILDGTQCNNSDVGLTALAGDLKSESATPALSYIAPDPCDDGSDTPCRTGAKAGLAQADAFLKTVVPEIEASPAYKDNGLILITFDEAPQSGPNWSTGSCCDQPTFPNIASTSTTSTSGISSTGTPSTGTPSTGTAPTGTASTTTTDGATTPTPTDTPTTPTPIAAATVPTVTGTTPTTDCTDPTGSSSTTGTTSGTSTTGCTPAIVGEPPGGGQVGLLMISPYVQPRATDVIDVYNHFSLLASEEQLFGLPALGYASDSALPTFNTSLFLASKR